MPNENELVTPQEDQEELESQIDASIKTNPEDKFVQDLEKKEDEDDETYQNRLKEVALKRHQSANELYARIGKIEKKIDAVTPQPKPTKEVKKTNQEQTLSEETILEQTVLISKGLELDDLKLLKDIQKVRSMNGEEKSLTELQDDPMFKANLAERKAKEAEEKASLPPSRGGKPMVKTPDFINKETGRMDHIAHKKWVQEQQKKG
jgi:hypothetical protein